MNKDRPSPFTGAGKILFIFTLALGCGGSYWEGVELLPSLPAGSYPLFYLFGPVVIAAFLYSLLLPLSFERKESQYLYRKEMKSKPNTEITRLLRR